MSSPVQAIFLKISSGDQNAQKLLRNSFSVWLTKFDWVFCCLTAPGIVHCLENFLNVFPQSGLNSARLHSEAESMSVPLPHHFCDTFSGKVRRIELKIVLLCISDIGYLDSIWDTTIAESLSLKLFDAALMWKVAVCICKCKSREKWSHVFANILQSHWFYITLAFTHNWIEWITREFLLWYCVGFLQQMAPRLSPAPSLTPSNPGARAEWVRGPTETRRVRSEGGTYLRGEARPRLDNCEEINCWFLGSVRIILFHIIYDQKMQTE